MENDSTLRAPALAFALAKPSLGGRIIRRLYTSNPFYVLSADLVFAGLRMSLDTSGKTFETSALMLSLLGYTLLLATTACLLIRFGKVWDDVRTLLLLVVAMFLATSVSFDATLASHPRLGIKLYVGGLAFALIVSEGLLRGIRLRLPALFRAPYYLILALFFLYPVALTPLLGNPDNPWLQWALFAFSPLSGVVFLTLLPAIRRGSRYVEANGSPWRYPLYPWVLFGLLGSSVCGRTAYLCISFHFVGNADTIFGPYFLVPFLLVAAVLWLEAGIVSRNLVVQKLAMLSLPALIGLASVGHRTDLVYQGFLTAFVDGLGASPLFLTLIAVASLYAIAALRRVPLALGGLTFSLLALSLVGHRTLDLDGLVAPRAWPLLAVAAIQFVLAIRNGRSRDFLLGSACLLAGLISSLGGSVSENELWLIAFHGELASFMLCGVWFRDDLARFVQVLGATLVAVGCLVFFEVDPSGYRSLPSEVVRSYPLLLSVIAVGYATLTSCRWYYAAAAVGLLGWLSVVGGQGYVGLRRMLPGLNWIVGGLAFFGLAAFISMGKAGVWLRWRERQRQKQIGSTFTGLE